MLVAQWFERGLGSIVAPEEERRPPSSSSFSEDDEGEAVTAAAPSLTDESASDRSAEGPEEEGDEEEEEEEEDGSDHGGGLWSIIAPDPAYYAERRKKKKKKKRDRNDRSIVRRSMQPPDDRIKRPDCRSSAALPGATTTTTMVECRHCGGTTPVFVDASGVVGVGGGGAAGTEKTPRARPPPTTTTNVVVGAGGAAGGATGGADVGFLTPQPAVRSPPAVVRASSANDDEGRGASPETPTAVADDLDELVLSAAKTTALSLSSPPAIWESRKNFLTLCASTKPFPPKKLKKFRRILEDDPSLLHCRGAGMGGSMFVPDGFGPLHVASMAGNLGAVEVLVEFDAERRRRRKKGGGGDDAGVSGGDDVVGGGGEGGGVAGSILDARDLQGRTALHVAAEHGRVDVVSYLKSAMTVTATTPKRPVADRASSPDRYRLTVLSPVGKNAPVDLSGRTPLGRAAVSRAGEAPRRRAELERELYDPGDVSVCGVPTPAKDRAGGGRNAAASVQKGTSTALVDEGGRRPFASEAELSYGYAEMPGRRIDMEDAICCAYPLLPPFEPTDKLGLFGVFDGHGDGGFASGYLADNFPKALVETDEWRGDNVGDDVADALAKGLARASATLDVELRGRMESARVSGGSTAVVVAISRNDLVCANVGDCRCVLVRRRKNTAGGGDGGEKELRGANATTGGGDDAEVIAAGVGSIQLGGDEGVDDAAREGRGGSADATKGGEGAASTGGDVARGGRSEEPSPVIVEPLSIDHKPNLPSERSRIEATGLAVVAETYRATKAEGGIEEGGAAEETIWKVRKSDAERLAVSRSFGDYDYKSNAALPPERQAIIAAPDVAVRPRTDDDLYVVLACDGVWDVMSNDDVGSFVHGTVEKLRTERRGGKEEVDEALLLPEVGDRLCEECLRRGSADNMSVLIVSLPTSSSSSPGTEPGGGSMEGPTATAMEEVEEVDGEGGGGDAVKRALEFDGE